MARYEAYGFKHIDDPDEKGIYLNSSDDLKEATRIGEKCPLEIGGYFGVYDTEENKWVTN